MALKLICNFCSKGHHYINYIYKLYVVASIRFQHYHEHKTFLPVRSVKRNWVVKVVRGKGAEVSDEKKRDLSGLLFSYIK